MNIAFIILAAGNGTRMKSSMSKVLHKVCQKSMIEIVTLKVINIIKEINHTNNSHISIVCNKNNIVFINDIILKISKNITSNKIDFTNNNNNEMIVNINNYSISTVIQKNQLGTADAVKSGLESINKKSCKINKVCVLYGDSPLFEQNTINKVLNNNSHITFVGFEENNKLLSYGRMIVDKNTDTLYKIVEFKDLQDSQKDIIIFNSGIVGGDYNVFVELLYKINNNNNQNEYYLTDLAHLANNYKYQCKYILCDKVETLGVNNMQELAIIENIMQNKIRKKMMEDGVHLIDPNTVFFSLDTSIDCDVVIEPNVVFYGLVKISSGTVIKSFSYIEDTIIGHNCSIGPFARLRAGNQIDENCKIGNFVEVKASKLNKEVKASHLSYIGDGIIGSNVNIGAGTIFCNYDGFNKYQSIVEDDVFIGSNSSIVAPVTLGKNSLIAAGSVVTKNVKNNDLFIQRASDITITDGAIKFKTKAKEKKIKK